MSVNCDVLREPKPGEWLSESDFATVLRLTPLVSIDLLVRTRDGRILLGRRKHEPARNSLFVPGGRITKNETIEAAFRRLTLDELGVEKRIEEARLLGAYSHFYPTNRLDREGFGTHYVVLAYELTSQVELESLPLDQHDDYVLFTEEECLASPQVHENTKAYFGRATHL